MNREFKRDLNNNYMILDDSQNKVKDDYRVRMLISNKIPFLLKCNVRRLDGVVKYYYEITSKQPISRVYEKKKIGKKELNTFIASFIKVIESSTEYLLNPNDFILEEEYIYTNVETGEVYFCYMPGYEQDINKNFHTLTAYLLEKIDHQDKNTVATAYELYRQTISDNFSIREILNSIGEEENVEHVEREQMNWKEQVKQEPLPIPLEEEKKKEKKEEKKTSLVQKIKQKPMYLLGGIFLGTAIALFSYFFFPNIEKVRNITMDNDLVMKLGGVIVIGVALIGYVLYKNNQVKKEDEEENLIVLEEKEIITEEDTILRSKTENTIVKSKADTIKSENIPEVLSRYKEESQEESYGNTMLLAYKSPNHKLIARKEKHNNFELTERTFLIGKMGEHVDGVIQDELISRIHAEIRRIDGSYYLTDLNSTNGTFLNDKRLEANETKEIKIKDIIRFAEAEYVFQ